MKFLKGLIVFALGLSLASAHLSPLTWQDESQILSFGEGYLLPHSGGQYVLNDQNEPKLAFCFAGAAFAYSFWHLLPGPFGHRYALILVAVLSAWLIYLHEKKKRTKIISLLLAASWLFEPSLCQSYRGGRVDIVALFLLLVSLSLWYKRNHCKTLILRQTVVVMAGVSIMAAGLSWISMVICFPFLISFFLVDFWRDEQNQRLFLKDFVLYLVSGMTFLGIVIGFAPDHMMGAFATLVQPSRVQLEFEGFSNAIMQLINAGKLSLVTMTTAIFSIVVIPSRRHKICMLFALATTLALVFLTRAYVHRFVYAMPVIFMCIDAGLGSIELKHLRQTLLLGVLAGTGILISGIARSAIAFSAHKNRDYTSVIRAVDDVGISSGDRVYDGTWQMYLASKNKFTPVRYWGHTYGTSLDSDENIMFECDWVFLPVTRPDTVANALTLSGYEELILTPEANAYGPFSVWHQHEND